MVESLDHVWVKAAKVNESGPGGSRGPRCVKAAQVDESGPGGLKRPRWVNAAKIGEDDQCGCGSRWMKSVKVNESFQSK